MNGTDGELIQRYAATRNAECFAELVTRYRDMVYSAAVRVVREPATAEDVTQECFLRLARTAASIKGSVAAWLHTVAVNASIDTLRQERSRRRREEQAADMTTHDEDEASWEQIKHEVHQGIERLPEKLREPLVLHFLAGMAQRALASELGVTQATVSRRIEQGVARLRQHLRQAGVVVSASALGTLLAAQTAEAAPATLVAALGKLALAGIPSAPPSAAVVGSALGRIAAAGWKAKAVCVVTAAVVAGAGVHQVTQSRSAPPAPAATQQSPAPTNAATAVPAAPEIEQADPAALLAAATATRVVQAQPPQRSQKAPAAERRKTVTVTGQVLDPEGQPVPNAELRLMYRSGPPNWWEALTGRADEHGRFTLKYEPGEQYQGKMFQVTALAEGYGVGIASGLPGEPDVAVHLTEAASVSGVVVDAEGEPVPAARVSVLSLRYARRGQRVVSHSWPVECRLHSETDARGRFRIDQFPSGATGALIIDAEGYAQARSQATAPQADARVILVRGGTATGRVLRNGQPVAGLRVSAQAAGSHDGWGVTTSGEDGKYELRDLAPGPYNLMLDPPEGLTAAAHEKVEVKSGETVQEMNFQLIEGGLVTGSVRDADTGEPVAALFIGAYGPARPRSSGYVQSAKTDEGGQYEFRLPAGENMLYVMGGVEGYSGDGAQPERHFVQVTEGQINESADFKVKRAPLLRGRALGPEGQYLPDAKVWLLQAALLSPSGSPLARTNAGGRFEAFLRENYQRSAAFYLLIRSADDSLAGLFLIEWEDQTTDFPLQPVAAVVGSVRDTAGQPVQGISVKCLSPRPPDQRFWTRGTVSAGTSDVEGKVELPTIPPGVELTLEAETKGFDVASEWPETLTLQPGETRDIGVLTMNRAGRSVFGLVHDADKHATVRNAVIVDLHTGRETGADDRGQFELTGLRFDRPALLLAHDSAKRLYVLQEVDPDEERTVVLLLNPLAAAEGIVLDHELQPAAGARVFAQMTGRHSGMMITAGRKHLPGAPETTTDENGNYRVGNLLDAVHYTVGVQCDGWAINQEVTAKSGPAVQVPDLVIPAQPPARD